MFEYRYQRFGAVWLPVLIKTGENTANGLPLGEVLHSCGKVKGHVTLSSDLIQGHMTNVKVIEQVQGHMTKFKVI